MLKETEASKDSEGTLFVRVHVFGFFNLRSG